MLQDQAFIYVNLARPLHKVKLNLEWKYSESLVAMMAFQVLS